MLIPVEATVWTLGHSTRAWEAFLDLLQEHRIEVLADVRRFPTSSRAPWASANVLPAKLHEVGIAYFPCAGLGGYRKPRKDSANTGWRNESFRGYADYMESREFAEALDTLIAQAKAHRTAIMCAEAVPWKCHRTLLSDALLVRGVRVIHVLGPGQAQEHALTPFAKVRSGRVSYPAARGKA